MSEQEKNGHNSKTDVSDLINEIIDGQLNGFMKSLSAFIEVGNDGVTLTVSAFHPNHEDELLIRKFNLAEVLREKIKYELLDEVDEDDLTSFTKAFDKVLDVARQASTKPNHPAQTPSTDA